MELRTKPSENPLTSDSQSQRHICLPPHNRARCLRLQQNPLFSRASVCGFAKLVEKLIENSSNRATCINGNQQTQLSIS